MVPGGQTWLSGKFVHDYIMYGHIGCHASNNDCSMAEKQCSYMNDCYNHGSCNNNGQCVCDSGFFGADCSVSPTDMSLTSST